MTNEQESEEVRRFKASKIKAEQGDAFAQVMFGGMYYFGKGVPQDEVEGYAWFLLANASGDEEVSEQVISKLKKRFPAEQMEKGQARGRRNFNA